MKIGIIGGTRGLGKTLAWFFKRENFDVTITGRDETVGKITSYELNVGIPQIMKKLLNLAT